MTKEQFYALEQRSTDRIWQEVYARGFCKGLDAGMSLDDACARGDQEVLDATSYSYEDDYDIYEELEV